MPTTTTTHYQANEFLTSLQQKTLYLGLFLSLPDKTGAGGEEVTNASYQRQLITFDVPVDSEMSNDAEVVFPLALDDWGEVVGYGLWDAQSGGQLLWYGEMVNPLMVYTGFLLSVAVNGLTLSIGLES